MANVPILNMPVATALDGNEYVPIVQTGTNKRATTGLIAQTFASGVFSGAIEVVVDGFGYALNAGLACYLTVPFDCTIQGATLLGSTSGSTSVDIWKCTYAQFDAGATHPVSGDTICGSTPPTISSATKSSNTTLTGWTTTLSEGDILAFNVGATTAMTRVTLSVDVARVVSSS